MKSEPLMGLLQEHRQRNPELCLFEGSHYLYGLMTHAPFNARPDDERDDTAGATQSNECNLPVIYL